ncbi:MAG: hypothetical protein EOO01_20910 [Chitinophagaceae bacterium]|nr:MAG: hypothetical protein EOO01_20910 [Chitinophagaceae bacterium]
MKYLFSIFLSVLVGSKSVGQVPILYADTSYTLKNLLMHCSYFWKKDSLGTNGFRAVISENISEVKVDSLPQEFVLRKLGPPTTIVELPQYFVYKYIVIGEVSIDSSWRGSKDLVFMAFFFKKNTQKLSFITHSFIER